MGSDFTDYRAETGHADNEYQPVSKDSKQEIGDRTGTDDSGTLPNGFVVKRLMTEFRCDRINPLIEHLHVAAKRDQGNHVLRTLTVGTTPQGAAEANGEAFYTDAAATGDPKVPELMHGDQYTERNKKCD
ncbi:hypothetical protein D3C80_1363190 [compost metagenome]